ncbi:MAG: outer membrane protein transport protein [Cyclobacteriaceae bacterium]|jgi:hypothetical protein|nr:outer membrane protein transport protein [Cyclobacteriaceae bacterium]
MRNWGNVLIGIIMLSPIVAGAQSFSETALLFSRTTPGGSARVLGMGGAQISLGGDYSSAYSNPAGLGMFNRSEFAFSFGYNSARSQASYLNNTTSETKNNFHVPGFGLVFHKDFSQKKLLSGTFGITYNRINNFNKNFGYQGTNSNNSIVDYFIEDATGQQPNSFLKGGGNFNSPTGLAYNNYLIEDSTFVDPAASPVHYLSVLGTYPSNPNDIRTVLQHEEVRTSGSQNQWSLSYGINFSDKIFFGAGLGITSLRFKANKTYRESDFNFVLDPSFNPLDNLVLEEQIEINGTGINGTFGLIVRPIDMIQIGISYLTPTFNSITDIYHTSLTTQWNNFDYFGDGTFISNVSEESEDVISEYNLKTPAKLNIGASVFIGTSGFITADVEVINYSGATYSSDISGITFNSENKEINELYQSTVNYRVGGEYRYNNWRARAGYAYMPDPLKSEQNGINRKLNSFSTGLGYRNKKFYTDLAIVFTQGKNSYRPYSINSVDSPLVTLTNKGTLGVLTVGIPF